MQKIHTLVRHKDIQNWVTIHEGSPAIVRERDSLGSLRQRLSLRFARKRPAGQPLMRDEGMTPCSWSAWLAELDRQQLALAVQDSESPAYEFVERRTMN